MPYLGEIGAINIRPSVQYYWMPKPDITAYELAVSLRDALLPSLSGIDCSTAIESMAPEVRRHFTQRT